MMKLLDSLPCRRLVIVAGHLALVAAAYLLSFLLRFEFRLSLDHWSLFLWTLPVILAIRLFVPWWGEFAWRLGPFGE